LFTSKGLNMEMENHFFDWSLPTSLPAPGVLVLHPWWGLNEFIRSFCDRLAEEGFAVLAPDLYHGKVAQTIPEAEKLRSKMNRQQAAEEIRAAAEALRTHPGVSGPAIGLIGFSLGGYLGLGLAQEGLDWLRCVILFYATRAGEYAGSPASYQAHFAETDPYVSKSGIQQFQKCLRAAERPAELYTYPGTGHWFMESDRPEAYNPQAAELAWKRTVFFLRNCLKDGEA
jgi:carboxymethylenebutenolidase